MLHTNNAKRNKLRNVVDAESATGLPPALVGLISTIELSNSDWWSDAVGRSVTFALWLEGRPLAAGEIRDSLARALGLTLSLTEVEEQVRRNVAGSGVIEVEPGLFKITEQCAAELVRDMESSEATEAAARRGFVQLLGAFVPDAEPASCWRSFNDQLLAPLIRELGVKTYRFLQGKPFDLKPSRLLEDLLAEQPERQREGFEKVVVAFLDPHRADARNYVIDRLTTFLFIQASSWSRASLEQLAKAATEVPTFTVFVDTNLLFSFLDLHENPANEAASALLALRNELSGIVNLKLYVTNETLLEARMSLQGAADAYRGIVLTPAIVAGTSDVRFSGLGQRFVEQASRSDGIRQSGDYFGYYVENLLLLAKERGLELFNEDLMPLHTHQEVIDDIVTATDFQNKRRKRRGLREKTYEQIRHDVVLWHFVRSKRDVYVESPLRARYWAVTADYSLLGFDAYKSQRRAHTIPVCLHPTGLIQMLRFWVPRGEELDSAIIRSLRMPFLFFKYDVALEEATLAVLRTLSRFENADQLSADAVASLVASDELRRRMTATDDPDGQVELVRLELIEQARELRARLTSAEQERQQLERTLAGVRRDIKQTRSDLAVTATQRLSAESRLKSAERRAATLRALLFLVACGFLLAVPVGGATVYAWVDEPRGKLVTVVVAAILWVSGSLLASMLVIKRYGSPAETEAMARYGRWNRWLWATVVVGLLVGVLTIAIYDSSREPVGNAHPTPTATPR